jgi:hypothetical protein
MLVKFYGLIVDDIGVEFSRHMSSIPRSGDLVDIQGMLKVVAKVTWYFEGLDIMDRFREGYVVVQLEEDW